MTYKSAVGLGGGKAVIIGDPRKDKTGSFQRLRDVRRDPKYRYITAEDVGTTMTTWISSETHGSRGRAVGTSGDPSPFTAFGTFRAMKPVQVRVRR